MKFLITGAKGQLGRELVEQLSKTSHHFMATDIEEMDITDIEDVRTVMREYSPNIVMNCAAYTAVDQCEDDSENAERLNTHGALNIAIVSNEIQAKIIHVSTDYVFDGNSEQPYLEGSQTNPSTVYGRTKLDGEQEIIKNNPRHFIVRTAWLYGEGKNFVRTMLSLSKTRNNLKVVNDQIGSPTSTVELAKAIIQLASTDLYGIYHATCEGQCTWYEFAKEIFSLSNIEIDVQPCTSEDFPQKAKRPAYSVLENANLKHRLNYRFPHWKQALTEYLSKELL